MFFLNKIYENRFEQNMQRHRLDAKIAPPKPQPACRFASSEQKYEPINRFMAVKEQKEKMTVNIQQTPPSPPPTYQEFIEPKLASTDSQLSLFEIQKPAIYADKSIKRSESRESGFCTGDSDVASQLSVQA